MVEHTDKGRKDVEVNVAIDLVEREKSHMPKVWAYGFSNEGELLESAQVSDRGVAQLKLSISVNDSRIRILVGPPVENEGNAFDDLIHRGAQEQLINTRSAPDKLELGFTVIPNIWKCWLLSACHVRGTLNKRVLVGGTYEDYPVCNATVEIYEVDPLRVLIPRLTIEVIERLRELIIHPRPLPDPPPDPFIDIPERFNQLSGHIPHEAQETQTPLSLRASNQASSPPPSILATNELQYIAQQGSRLQFEQALIDNAFFIRPLLCHYYPHLLTMQRVATAQSDECGRFQTVFFKGCNNPDTPDLYFKARQKFFGWFDITIYAPTPVHCHTRWNYQCGSEVKLYTSHPWAQTCTPCPPVIGPGGTNRWVAFMAIGARGLNHLYGASKALAPQVTVNNRGLTPVEKAGLGTVDAPWGGTLLPRLEFSNALQDAGVVYYRLSWRKDAGNAVLPEYLPLTTGVKRYYRYDVPTATGDMPAWSPESLGPFSVDDGSGTGNEVANLFKIPYPSVAPKGVWDVPPHITEIKEHLASAVFPSKEGAAAPGIAYDSDGNPLGIDTSGKHQLRVDLFDANGQAVDIAALGIVYAVPTDPDGTSGTIHTTNAADPDLNLVQGNSMIVPLHIDNNPCFAEINAPTINGAEADPCCGVLGYSQSDSLTMSWNAFHPNGFAMQRFFVQRGTNTVFNTGWT
ncbi:MAG: hypothetical protein KUG71_05360, partial [Porticoccaceae bacterium]|nr:hypothetical protein [Porticoccaceae bacterium]